MTTSLLLSGFFSLCIMSSAYLASVNTYSDSACTNILGSAAVSSFNTACVQVQGNTQYWQSFSCDNGIGLSEGLYSDSACTTTVHTQLVQSSNCTTQGTLYGKAICGDPTAFSGSLKLTLTCPTSNALLYVAAGCQSTGSGNYTTYSCAAVKTFSDSACTNLVGTSPALDSTCPVGGGKATVTCSAAATTALFVFSLVMVLLTL